MLVICDVRAENQYINATRLTTFMELLHFLTNKIFIASVYRQINKNVYWFKNIDELFESFCYSKHGVIIHGKPTCDLLKQPLQNTLSMLYFYVGLVLNTTC